MNVKEELSKRCLPDLFTFEDGTKVTCENAYIRRKELIDILQRDEYGAVNAAPDYVRGNVTKRDNKKSCAGKAIDKTVELTVGISGKEFTFSFRMLLPKKIKKPPFVIIANFRREVPDDYIPAEELIDRGIGFASFCYKLDITSDDNDFTDKLSGIFYPDGIRKDNDPGKIAMWSYCASRILDYVLENESVDTEKIAVAGHSRLGKTALYTAAVDTRFTCAYSNDSGCSGAALSRGKIGETVEDITRVFPFWFTPGFSKYSGKESEMPFDQHFLIAAIAPRKVYVASAKEDLWADPKSEYLSCCAAGEFWKLFGKKGFCGADKEPVPDDKYHDGDIGYHIRHGVHYFSREDWNNFLDFFLK